MPSDRTQLLRILSNLDQSLAKIERIIEHEQTYDGWQISMAIQARLEDAYARTIDALMGAV
jgi:hypothetical protein